MVWLPSSSWVVSPFRHGWSSSGGRTGPGCRGSCGGDTRTPCPGPCGFPLSAFLLLDPSIKTYPRDPPTPFDTHLRPIPPLCSPMQQQQPLSIRRLPSHISGPVPCPSSSRPFAYLAHLSSLGEFPLQLAANPRPLSTILLGGGA